MKIPPPRPGLAEDDRDAACYDAIQPHIEKLYLSAIKAGWHPAEVLVQIATMCLGEIREHVGVELTLRTIDQIRVEVQV